MRPVWNCFTPTFGYTPGVAVGPNSVASSVAGAKARAELAAATGMSTTTGGVRASAAAGAAVAAANRAAAAGTSITAPAEALVLQTETFEADGRYRSWCRGYRMGTYWATYDTAIANWEALHGLVGGGAEVGATACADSPNGAPRLPPRRADTKAALIALARSTTLANLAARLDARIAPGTTLGPPPARGVTPAYAAAALAIARLHPTAPLAAASAPRRVGTIHTRVPAPVDYGALAAFAFASKVRLNVGPVEGRTPLNVAVDRGRLEIVWLLLSHADPEGAEKGVMPFIKKKEEMGGWGRRPLLLLPRPLPQRLG